MHPTGYYGKLSWIIVNRKKLIPAMKRPFRAGLLCLAFLLSGCAQTSHPATDQTEPAALSSCYTDIPHPDAVVARMEDAILTNDQLQVWYWAEIAQYRESGTLPAPDFDSPLDLQTCPLTGADWHQYFLDCSLNRWHTAQALIRHSQQTPVPTEEAYDPDLKALHKYMDGMPATQVLYGFDSAYRPNSLHNAYLDTLDDTLLSLAESLEYSGTEALAAKVFGASEKALADYTRDLNYGYMYFTDLTYDLESEIPASPEATPEPVVDISQILLLPERGESINHCLERARTLLEKWMSAWNSSAATFAQLASQHSLDPGSAPNGGTYRNLRRDQLPESLAEWCFDAARQEGDTAILPAENGVHILLFLSRRDASVLSAREEALSQAQKVLLDQIRQQYPMTVESDAISLTEARGTLSASALLYPDIAHQRFPEVPLYLQQSYPHTMYGEYKISTNGCGITTLAMLASYMTDEELTPPEMCARYGRYSLSTGTAGSLFEDAPAQLGFYLIKKTYDWREARDYMQEGHPVVVCQYRGYWTSGGHYLLLESLCDDGMVQVRDSNMYNYYKLPRHKEDKFPWDTISFAGQGYWIYEKKATVNAACTRCGDPESLEHTIVTGYLCEKCASALLRRNSYLHLPV